ncbi:uncharacterized protein TNCV_5054571 [Trichonephila clavipes]|nr:uncharacterized protein TNCV_5054571 [Trichonephila clavipes]
MQRYYGLPSRNNSGNLSAMKQAIWSIFFDKISTDLNPQHGLYPLGDDSWCGYNRSKLKGDTYRHKHNLPIAIMYCIKKVFRDLSSPELLSRCLHEFSFSNFHEGTQIATINTRFVYAMRSIGKGADAGRMFCGVMNLPQPPTRFSPYGKRILNAAKLVYEDSIQNVTLFLHVSQQKVVILAFDRWSH